MGGAEAIYALPTSTQLPTEQGVLRVNCLPGAALNQWLMGIGV